MPDCKGNRKIRNHWRLPLNTPNKNIEVMKTKHILFIVFLFGMLSGADAQIFKKIKKRAEEAAKETVLRKVEEKTAEKTEKAIDSVFNAPKKVKRKKKSKKKGKGKTSQKQSGNGENYEEEADQSSANTPLSVYSKFDFVAGEDIILFDDFSADALGDFPSNWDTNGSGELVDVNGQKWFKLSNNAIYMPIYDGALPKEFTAEFDLHAVNFAQGSGPGVLFQAWVDENATYDDGKNNAGVTASLWDGFGTSFRARNKADGKDVINNNIDYDLREQFRSGPVHVSIAVNKRRFRYWINEHKIVDIPRLIPDTEMAALKMRMKGYKEAFLITNFKLAAGGQDLRAQLINEGKFSTTGILFDSGSASIKPESYGILKKIANALKDGTIQVTVVGHTDADGDEEANLTLSEARAEAVAIALIDEFGVSEEVLSYLGRGESEPVADNSTAEGKAKNRRVEFIKQ